MNSTGKMGSGTILLLLGVGVVAVLIGMGYIALPASVAPSSIQMTQREEPQGCASNTTPELKLVGLDRVNTGTTLSDDLDANVYFNGTAYKGFRLSSDSTVDAAPGDGYTIFFTGTSNNHDYLGAVATGNVPCNELETVNVTIAQTGTMNLTAFNDDDGLANAKGDTQAISNGETVNIEFEIKENTADKCLGTANSDLPLGLCADYNSNVIKTPVLKLNGASLPTMSVPEGHSSIVSATTGAADRDTTVCWKLEGIKEICDYKKETGFSFQLEGKASLSPAAAGGVSDDLNVWVYQPQLYKNSETGQWAWGYSNPVDANAIIYPAGAGIFLA